MVKNANVICNQAYHQLRNIRLIKDCLDYKSTVTYPRSCQCLTGPSTGISKHLQSKAPESSGHYRMYAYWLQNTGTHLTHTCQVALVVGAVQNIFQYISFHI